MFVRINESNESPLIEKFRNCVQYMNTDLIIKADNKINMPCKTIYYTSETFHLKCDFMHL